MRTGISSRLCRRPAGVGLLARGQCEGTKDVDQVRQFLYVQMLQGLVGVRVQERPTVPDMHPLASRRVPHHPLGRPRTPGGAQTAAERRRPGDRATDPPRRGRHLVFSGGQLGVLLSPGR